MRKHQPLSQECSMTSSMGYFFLFFINTSHDLMCYLGQKR
jgi:hypothetical protein